MTKKRFLLVVLIGLSLWALWGLNRPYYFGENSFVISDFRTPESNVDMVSLTCPRDSKRDIETCGCIRTAIFANTSLFERYLFTYGNSWISGYSVWQGGRNAGLTTAEITKMSARVNGLVPKLTLQCEMQRAEQLKNQQPAK
jgi:hypothetical protein